MPAMFEERKQKTRPDKKDKALYEINFIRMKAGLREIRRSQIPCMCCRKPFESEGPHNRMCYLCSEKPLAADI